MPKSKLREGDSRVPLSGETNEPTPKKWRLSAEISSVAQNGLRNQGATCYLNSGLQILFMTKEFREAVLNSKRLKNFSNDNDVLNQLRQLFENLSDGHKPSGVSTVNITKALSIGNVYEQQDAVEWFEKILNEVPEETSKVYKGTLRKTLKCLTKLVEHADCQEDSTFFSIPLSISSDTYDVYDVVDGLKDFFQTTRSEEDDRMYCDDCNEKTDTEISFNIQKYPTILILHVKRFYFDYFQMGFQKNSCQMDIPLELMFFKDCPYDLYGVINHIGQYRGGHYDAYIKPHENDHWYCFDDSCVTKIAGHDFLKRSRTAYMIVYRKRSSQRFKEKNTVGNTAEDALKKKAEDELQRRESLPPSHEEPHTPKNPTEDTDVNEFTFAWGGISGQILIPAHQDTSLAVAEEEMEIREPLPSSHQQQNTMKTCTEDIAATVNEVSKVMTSSPLAEIPPCQNGFQAVAEDEMERSEQSGKSSSQEQEHLLPSSQEQNTINNHTEASAVGVQLQERVSKEKDSTLAEIPPREDAPQAVSEDEMEMGEERGEYLPSSHQEQNTPKTFPEDTSAIVNVVYQENKSSPLAEIPPSQDGFLAVEKDEMEMNEQTGKSLPLSQEQKTMKNHTEDTSAVGVQERVSKEKDSTLAEIPPREDAPQAVSEDDMEMGEERGEYLPSSHQEQNTPKTFTEDNSAIVNLVSQENKSNPLAEIPPGQDGFQAVAKDEMEMSEQTGKSLPSSQEQNTINNHTEDTSAVGVDLQERVSKEMKDSTLAKIPPLKDPPQAVEDDEMEMDEKRGEHSPSSQQEQNTPKTCTEDTSAIVNKISEIGHSAPTVKGTNTTVPQPKKHQDERKQEMNVNVNKTQKGCGAGQEDKFREDNPLLISMHVDNYVPSQDSVPATSTIVDLPEVSSPFIRKAPRRRCWHAPYPCSKLKGKNAWLVVLIVILGILLVTTLIILLWIL